MEAALRSVYAILAGEEAPSLDFKEVRGTQGIKEATYEVPIKGGKPIKVNIAVELSTQSLEPCVILGVNAKLN